MDDKLFQLFFTNSPTAYSIQKLHTTENGTEYEFIGVNKAYIEMMELQDQDIVHKKFHEVFPSGWEDEEKWWTNVDQAVIEHKPVQFDVHRYLIQKWIRILIFPLRDDLFGCIYYDVTKEYLQDKEIEGFFNVNIDMMCVADVNGTFLKVNKAFEEILGYKVSELEGKKFTTFIHDEDISSVEKIMKQLKGQNSVSSYIVRVRRKDGVYRYIEWHSQPNGNYIYASGRDITEARKTEIQLTKNNKRLVQLTKELEEKNKLLNTLAKTDELTGLYNRHYLVERIEDEMNRADHYNEPITIAIFDIDHFKKVNDTWGHPVGDKVLREMATLVSNNIRSSDIFIRFGGEEFVIIMLNTNLQEAYKLSERIRTTIEKHKFSTVGNLTVSFGVAEKLRFEEFYHWYNRVDEALYEAKEGGRNRTVISKVNELIEDEIEDIIATDWKSGHFHIDKQHKMLMEEANQLMILYHAKGGNIEQYMKQLDFMLDLIATHFKDEERIIEKLGFPNAEGHKKIHDDLLRKAYSLKEGCLKGEIEHSKLFSFIVDEVILKHSLITDREYFDYTKTGEHH